MKKVKLVGFSCSVPKHLEMEATTYREVLDALKLHAAFNPRKNRVRYLCEISGVRSSLDLDSRIEGDTVTIKRTQTIKPGKKFQGSGDNGAVKIVIGIILIVIAIYIMPATTAAWAFAPAATTSVNLMMATIGLSLIAGGIAQELLPEVENSSTDEESYNAGSYPNTVASGTPRAMIFGTHRFGGHVFSFNIESVNQSSAKIRDFTSIVWDQDSDNRRDSWLTLYYNSESGSAASSGWDRAGSGKWFQGELP